MLRPSLSPQKCFTPTPLLQLAADDAKFGYQVGRSMLVFGGWSIVGAPNSNNTKGRAYLYKIFLGAWDYRQTNQASDGSDGDYFGRSVSINEKIMVVGAADRDNDEAVYEFTL